MKKCIICGNEFESYNNIGVVCSNKCRMKQHQNACKIYEKTKSGFLMRLYRNMKSRITGINKKKAHLYKGKCLLSKDDFYKWANESKEFHKLFKIWEDSEYQQKLSPSVDRIDSSIGYKLDNMEWVTHSENSRRGVISKNKVIKM